MPFTKTWNEASPAGADDVAQGDDAIRDFKYAVRERLAVDHYFLDSEAGDAKIGYHKFLTMIDQSTPAAVADAIRLYSKVVSSESELHVIDEDSNEYQLTLNQRLWLSALRIASQAQGDIAYFNGTIWTRLAAGTSGQFLKTLGSGSNPAWGTPTTASKGFLYGFVISNDSGDVTNDLSIGAGECRDDTDTYDIVFASAFVKRGDAVFAAGTAAGGGDITGSAGIRYIYAIGKSTDSSAADIAFSASAPGSFSYPSGGWDIKRLIGCRRWGGSAWTLFKTHGNGVHKTVMYDTRVTLASGVATGASWTSIDTTGYVPSQTSTLAFGTVGQSSGAANNTFITNDSSADLNSGANHVGASGTNMRISWRLNILTANTLYYYSHDVTNGIVLLAGYEEAL